MEYSSDFNKLSQKGCCIVIWVYLLADPLYFKSAKLKRIHLSKPKRTYYTYYQKCSIVKYSLCYSLSPRVNLSKNLDQFDVSADKFEKLPLYFMAFHGEQSLQKVLEVSFYFTMVFNFAHMLFPVSGWVTQLSFWYECATQRAENKGLKNRLLGS